VRAALAGDEYVVEFDARLDAATRAVTAVEARIRWTNPELAAVAADKIARAAEVAGLLVLINQRVLRAACDACASWQRAGAPVVPVAVGIATGQITDAAFAASVRDALAAAVLDAGMLELSATEDVLLFDAARAARTLTALKSLGVRVAVDAFGTGKASFADLQRFPIGALKLHSSRLDGIALDIDKQRYADGVIALGRALGLEVVATGVANAADAEYLRAGGCSSLQGPVAPQAMTAVECEALLRDRR
jgi:EAL domain-containing protein (putative c-di-GMP-specific phosphodiesterase class I)